MKKKLLCLFIIFLCFMLSACGETYANNSNVISVNDISINKSHAYVDVDKSTVLLAQVFPFNADNQKVIWKSANPEIALVSDGIVTGKKEGRTTILATSEDGNLTASCIVYVSTPKLDYDNTNKNTNQSISNVNIIMQNIEDDKDNQFYFVDNFFNYINQFINVQKEFSNNFLSNINFTIDENLDNSNEKFSGIIYYYNSNGIDEVDNDDYEIEQTIYKDNNTIVKKIIN